MSNLVQKVAEYNTGKRIMIGQDSYYLALGCRLAGTPNEVIKAGEPLNGDITKRDSDFTVASGAGDGVGINLHDVKLDSDGNGNATLVMRGCVDALKLDPAVYEHLKTVKPEGIVIVEGSEF